MGWRSTDSWRWLSEAWACAFATLPLGRFCKLVIKLIHTTVQTVLSAPSAGQIDNELECPIGGPVLFQSLKRVDAPFVVRLGTRSLTTDLTKAYEWHPGLQT